MHSISTPPRRWLGTSCHPRNPLLPLTPSLLIPPISPNLLCCSCKYLLIEWSTLGVAGTNPLILFRRRSDAAVRSILMAWPCPFRGLLSIPSLTPTYPSASDVVRSSPSSLYLWRCQTKSVRAVWSTFCTVNYGWIRNPTGLEKEAARVPLCIHHCSFGVLRTKKHTPGKTLPAHQSTWVLLCLCTGEENPSPSFFSPLM